MLSTYLYLLDTCNKCIINWRRSLNRKISRVRSRSIILSCCRLNGSAVGEQLANRRIGGRSEGYRLPLGLEALESITLLLME